MNGEWQLMALAGVLMPILGGMIAYMVRTRSLVGEIKDEMHDHKVYALEHFATGLNLREAELRLTAHLERIESYLKLMVDESHGQSCAPAKRRD